MNAANHLRAVQETLAELQTKRDDLAARQKRIDAERDRIAFVAETGASKKAADRLAAIETEEGELDRRAKSLDAALRTAQRKFDAAKAAADAQERVAEARRRYGRAKDSADELQTAGEDASKAMTEFVVAMARIKAASDTLRENASIPSAELVGVILRNAIKSELIAAELIEPTVPKGDRRTIAEASAGYAESARSVARKELEIELDEARAISPAACADERTPESTEPCKEAA